MCVFVSSKVSRADGAIEVSRWLASASASLGQSVTVVTATATIEGQSDEELYDRLNVRPGVWKMSLAIGECWMAAVVIHPWQGGSLPLGAIDVRWSPRPRCIFNCVCTVCMCLYMKCSVYEWVVSCKLRLFTLFCHWVCVCVRGEWVYADVLAGKLSSSDREWKTSRPSLFFSSYLLSVPLKYPHTHSLTLSHRQSNWLTLAHTDTSVQREENTSTHSHRGEEEESESEKK